MQGDIAQIHMKNHSYVQTTEIVQPLHPTSAASPAQSWHGWMPDLLLSIPRKDSFLFPCQLCRGIHCLQVLPEPFHLPHRRFSVQPRQCTPGSASHSRHSQQNTPQATKHHSCHSQNTALSCRRRIESVYLKLGPVLPFFQNPIAHR